MYFEFHLVHETLAYLFPLGHIKSHLIVCLMRDLYGAKCKIT